MNEAFISSPGNTRLKAVQALRRRRQRDRTETTLVDGIDELRLALSAGAVPRELYGCPELMPDPAIWERMVAQLRSRGTTTVRLSRTAFAKVTYREHPDGMLAVVDTPADHLGDLRLPTAPLVLICAAVEKPGNLGAILRTADAAGVSAVLAADPITDWGNPNLIRASRGTVFTVPVASAGTDQTLAWLADHGIRLVATTPATDADYTDVDLTGPVAIALGAEDVGLSEEFLTRADALVRVPMVGRVNSLNVATTGALLAYEAIRQRRAGPDRVGAREATVE